MVGKNKKKILVFTHDAGGSEMIAAYIKKNFDKFIFVCYVGGPGRDIFRRYGISIKEITDNDSAIKCAIQKNKDSFFVLIGTGWMTNIELSAIREAKNFGMRTVCYLDSWVNFRERFGYPKIGWQKWLPDELWTADEYAKDLAEKFFGKYSRIRFMGNPYFYFLRKEYEEIKRNTKRGNGAVLFLTDLLLQDVRPVLKKTLSFFSKMRFERPIIIRLHPAEQRNKYDHIVRPFKRFLNISISKNKNILDDMVLSSVVIGTETMALVVGVICHKKVISITTGMGLKKFPLPFKQIVKIKDIKQLGRLSR